MVEQNRSEIDKNPLNLTFSGTGDLILSSQQNVKQLHNSEFFK